MGFLLEIVSYLHLCLHVRERFTQFIWGFKYIIGYDKCYFYPTFLGN